jgi:hypothetical protein
VFAQFCGKEPINAQRRMVCLQFAIIYEITILLRDKTLVLFEMVNLDILTENISCTITQQQQQPIQPLFVLT